MSPIKYYSTLGYYAVHIGHNGKPRAIASIGVFFTDNDQCNLSERLPGLRQTNNRAELFAVIRALEICDRNQDITINTD
ncbi:6515_t:CDS:2, partial [Scutellospora calospora]